jgi:DNA polymerase III epsilon subunit-like protein
LVIVALCRNLVHVLTSALDNCAARRLVAIVGGLGLDMELNVTGRPTTLYCQPWPDHLPDPLACLLTGITPQRCQQVGLPELQFVEAVHRELAAPATIAFGYNSIAFDDEITRLMFRRNLMDPYARKWKDDCGRWDLLRLVRATQALHPETLEWPRDEQGEVSLRLERISAANGQRHESAHDALSDVVATVALARRIRERQPQLFAHCFSMLDKNLALQERVAERRTQARMEVKAVLTALQAVSVFLNQGLSGEPQEIPHEVGLTASWARIRSSGRRGDRLSRSSGCWALGPRPASVAGQACEHKVQAVPSVERQTTEGRAETERARTPAARRARR